MNFDHDIRACFCAQHTANTLCFISAHCRRVPFAVKPIGHNDNILGTCSGTQFTSFTPFLVKHRFRHQYSPFIRIFQVPVTNRKLLITCPEMKVSQIATQEHHHTSFVMISACTFLRSGSISFCYTERCSLGMIQ